MLKNKYVYYFITLWFLLISSKANFLFVTEINWFVLDLILLALVFIQNKIRKRDLKFFGTFLGSFFLLVIVRHFVNSLETSFILADTLFVLKFLMLTFLYCVYLRELAIRYIVKVISHLAFISLIFYALQITVGGAFIFSLGKSIQALLPAAGKSDEYTNFLIYTYNQKHSIRNSGFSWEPGAYGCFLIIALMLNFCDNEFKLDRKAKILLIALVTTLSTTAYLSVLIMGFIYYRMRGGKINAAIIIILPIVLFIIFTVPFLGDKVTDIYNSDISNYGQLDHLNKYYSENQRQIPLNRFSSILFIFSTFGYKTILGISNQYNQVYIQQYDVNLSNGIIDLCARFGIIGFAFLLYRFYEFFKLYLLKNEYVIYCLIVISCLSFGETILILPMFLSFLFLPGIIKNDLYYNSRLQQA